MTSVCHICGNMFARRWHEDSMKIQGPRTSETTSIITEPLRFIEVIFLTYVCVALNHLLRKHITQLLLSRDQMVKNLPAVQEIWVWPLGQEDPLEKEIATHSTILAWRIPWTEETGGYNSKGHRVRSEMTEQLFYLFKTGWITSQKQDCQRNTNNLRYANDTTLMPENKEELKSFLMKVKEEVKKLA